MFAIVTFPFLFGIMFGDIGHGFALLFVGSLLCIFCDAIRAKAPGMEAILSIRYIVLLMGFFAFYCGIIYNDFMAIPLWLFESCYDLKEIPSKNPENTHGVSYDITYKEDCNYPIGVDPAWYLGINELTFLNSLKMKIAVILGVL